jgi:2,3-diketo-5-methylthio-1-phosphopentane phosphatase
MLLRTKFKFNKAIFTCLRSSCYRLLFRPFKINYLTLMESIEKIENVPEKKKMLMIFDLDHTILSQNSDTEILHLLSEKSKQEIKQIMRQSDNWALTMQEVYNRLKKEQVSIEKIKDVIQNIPFNPGFSEIFEFLKNNQDKFDTLIVSGANTLFIKWILEKHKLEELFPKYYSMLAEPNEDLLIKITQNHVHDCESCDKSQCKNLLLKCHFQEMNPEEFREHLGSYHYSKVMFAGDGDNDLCAGKILKEEDILFPRKDFALHKLLKKHGNNCNLTCKIIIWETGLQILEVISKLM